MQYMKKDQLYHYTVSLVKGLIWIAIICVWANMTFSNDQSQELFPRIVSVIAIMWVTAKFLFDKQVRF